MSAPWEVWLLDRPDAVSGRWFDAPDNGAETKQVRYLRADLMCGECAYHSVNSYEACSHANRIDIPGSGAMYFTPADSRPACTAFTPKEQR